MGIVLKDILAVLPGQGKDEVRKTSIYIEGTRIAAVGKSRKGFRKRK